MNLRKIIIIGIAICLDDIVFGERLSNEVNFAVSLITFIIYKEWLLLSLENKSRTGHMNSNVLISELKHRNDVYKNIKYMKKCTVLIDYIIEQLYKLSFTIDYKCY